MSTPSSPHVDGHEPDRLHGVGVKHGAVLVGDARQLGDRLQRADDVVGHMTEASLRVVAEGGRVRVDVDEAVRVHGDEVDRPAERGCRRPRRLHDGRMLDGADDEVRRARSAADSRPAPGCRASVPPAVKTISRSPAPSAAATWARASFDGRARLAPTAVELRRVAVLAPLKNGSIVSRTRGSTAVVAAWSKYTLVIAALPPV